MLRKYLILPPASWGSKGDEGMLRGCLSLFSPAEFMIANPDNGAWILDLMSEVGKSIREFSFDEIEFLEKISDGYELIVVGADVIDGSCGVYPSIWRLDIIEKAIELGGNVRIFFSYRSGVQSEIRLKVKRLAEYFSSGVSFYLRDHDSLQRFRGEFPAAKSFFFPDLAFFCEEVQGEVVKRAPGGSVIGLNFSEHTFRAACATHSDESRKSFVDGYVEALIRIFPKSTFRLFTNDLRSWDDAWSDFDYALVAKNCFERKCCSLSVDIVDPFQSYGQNISSLRSVDYIFTGRMHLAIAALRARCIPVLITGKGGQSKIFANNLGMYDKARGMLGWFFNRPDLVVTSIDELDRIASIINLEASELILLINARFDEIKENSGSFFNDLDGANHLAEFCPAGELREPYFDNVLKVLRRDWFEMGRAVSREKRKAAERLFEETSARDAEIAKLSQAIGEYESKMVGLSRAISERESQIDNMGRAIGERDVQIVNLGRTINECESQIASFREILRERDDQITSFGLAEMERDNHVASLTQAVTARDEQIISVNQTIEQLESQLGQELACSEAYKNSLSWRVTAPMRWVAAPLVFFYRLAIDPNVYWRLLAVIFLIPVAVVYYHGFWGMVKNLPRRWLAFDEILRNEDEVNDRMDGSSELSRKIVFTCFSIAIRLKRTSSIRRSVVNLLNIFKHEGGGAFMGHLRNTSPDQLSAIPEVNAGSDVVHVLDVAVGKRILVSDYRIPRPDVSAGERATMGILQDLCSLGYEVFFLPNNMASSPRYEAALRSAGVHIITQASGFEYSAHYLEKYGDQFGVFYFIRVDVAENLLPIARRVAPDARVIFHAPDLYFLRELRGAELQNDPVARERALHTRDRELAMMGRSDRVVVVSPAEVPVLRTVLPDTPISVFPVLYAPVVANPRPYARRKHIFFLGGFAHPPNVSAVQWFASAVWPHVREALPDVEFHILGAEAPDTVVALGKQSGIKVVGFVPELEPVLETLRVGVAPLQYGAGIKGKVAVTMGAGIPCVCTGVAAEGMGIKNDVHALIEDDPVRFAQAVVRLYNDEKAWSRLAKYGQALVDENYGNAANRASLLRVLDQAQALPVSLFINYCQAAAPVSVPNPGLEAQVDISIIIPVFNKWNLTRACLTSVVQTSVGNGVVYEILLADDGSTDETTGASEFFPGLRVVKTPKNMGFLRNCNNAAQHARGRYLLLLNNDTVVLPGWLDRLYRTIEEDSSIAIAGSKLLYPDEHIQEAGGGLLSDADGVSVGRWRWVGEQNFPVRRHDPLFNIRRETDYISGASILVRKSFWDSVGGFDERYKNAYCEDSDLAMMARSKGLRVVYEPGSEVIHFEHQTYSGQISADHARLQRENKARLIAKWRDVLEHDHLPAGSKWYQVAAHGERCVPVAAQTRRKRGNLNILYFSPFPSHPSNHGNQATIQQFAQQFQKMGHKVHFALLQSGMYSREHEKMMRDAWDTFDILPNSHPLGSNGHPIPFDGWYEEGLGERIRLLCARYDIDMVFCSYIFQSKMLEYVPNYILKVIDTHDKMGDRYEMLRKNGQPLEFFSCTPEEEGAYLRRADVVVARRAEEARYFDSVTGRKTAIVIPHVEAPQFLDRNFDNLKHVGVVASANRINLAIVRELLEAIDRKLGDGACPFIVHVAGQVKDMVQTLPANERAVFARSWVRMHGFVPDIAKFYGDVNLVISPVTMGTGINVKTVQAMAYGMPLLTTECGSKGIETPELLHHHESLDALVASLLSLKERPNEIARLAEVSRSCYMEFHEKANAAFAGLWCHPRLGCSVV